jgi:hypothetical protein
MGNLQGAGPKILSLPGIKSVVRSVDVVDVGPGSSGPGLLAAGTIWTGIRPTRKGDDGPPDAANEAVGGARRPTPIDAIVILATSVDSSPRSRATQEAIEDGYAVEETG